MAAAQWLRAGICIHGHNDDTPPSRYCAHVTFPMNRRLSHQLLGAAAAGLGLSLLSALPASAHGGAGTDLASGLSHPLLGLDHLLLLVGVGTASATLGSQVLLFALAGTVVGALVGSFGGAMPGAEVLAALAVSAVGLLVLQRERLSRAAGPLVAAAVAVHAMLHGQESTGSASWWLGAALAAVVVVGGTHLALGRSSARIAAVVATLLCLGGGVLALGALA